MGMMQLSISKGQRAMIAAGIAVAVFACARERYNMEVWTVEYGPRNTCTVEHGLQSTDIWMYGPTVAPNLTQNGLR